MTLVYREIEKGRRSDSNCVRMWSMGDVDEALMKAEDRRLRPPVVCRNPEKDAHQFGPDVSQRNVTNVVCATIKTLLPQLISC